MPSGGSTSPIRPKRCAINSGRSALRTFSSTARLWKPRCVEAKVHPNDIDGYFVCDARRIATGELQRELNQIDPKKCWTWDAEERRAYRGYAKKQLPMWHAYRVELYPHYDQFTGITDEHGHPLTFPAAFRKRRRDDKPKGIVKVIPD